MNLRLCINSGKPHRFSFKKYGSAIAYARGNQVLHHFLLRVHHDRFPGQILKINAVTGSTEAQLYPSVKEPLTLHAFSDSRFPQHIDRALFEYPRADTTLYIFTRMTFQHDALNALQVQQMRQHQARGPGSHNADLCANGGHGGVVLSSGKLLDYFLGDRLTLYFGRIANLAHRPHSLLEAFHGQFIAAK